MPGQHAAVKAGAWWTGEGEKEADAQRSCPAGGAASRWVVQPQVTADYSGWQRRRGLLHRKSRQAKRVCTWTFGSRSSPGKFVSRPGNLLPGN